MNEGQNMLGGEGLRQMAQPQPIGQPAHWATAAATRPATVELIAELEITINEINNHIAGVDDSFQRLGVPFLPETADVLGASAGLAKPPADGLLAALERNIDRLRDVRLQIDRLQRRIATF